MVQTPGRGLASGDLADLSARVLASWDEFLSLATTADLSAPSRLPGWRGREVLLHLGTWDDRVTLTELIASAKAGAPGEPYDADSGNEVVIRAHAGATDDEVLQALQRSRDAVAAFFKRGFRSYATSPAMSTLGPLPLAGIVHAGCYELAVHALDLAPCGARRPDDLLLNAGLGALIDVTGGLAARHGIHVPVSAQTPDGGWRTDIDGDTWRTERTDPGKVDGPAILGSAVDVLDASAGRAAVPLLLLQRRIVVQDLTQFLRLAPLVEEVPGIPGAALLKRAASTVSGVTRGL
ncbi:MAG TPA: maleylpyruvate isomerase N-terminal domain-containing protein, partial [Mycobacteriales bacterium]|nr:maleylpyruvate isomerase N-terminal domain-containing protein [Mycobacteriales bacterium]